MLGNSPSIAELQSHIRSGMPLERKVDLIQVPTTAGTGAEVTPWASVWSEEGKKSSVDHPAGFADYAFVDPALTDSMPSRLSVAVGLDAMTHAMESLWGRHGNSFSNTLATRALELLQAELPQVIDAPTQQSRNGMTLGALLAGMALSTTRSAIAHALSYQLTGEHNIEHGLAVGLIALAVFKLPAEEAPQERARVVQACGRESAEELAEFLETNFRNIGMTTSLSRLGVPAEAISAIIKTAIASNRLGNMSGEWNEDRLTRLLTAIS